MTDLENAIIKRCSELLSSGEVKRVVGWTKGEFIYDPSPATFESVDSLKDFVYNDFCGANLSKYMIEISKKEGKTAVLLKPCDTYSFNQLLKEHRINRENVYIVGIECQGKLDMNKINEKKIDGVLDAKYENGKAIFNTINGEKSIDKDEVLLYKCQTCKSKKHVVFDETIILNEMPETKNDRFSGVESIEKMKPADRYNFWKNQLSKCIRCNACRNVCPACSCLNCVFDNPKSGVSAKANDVSFEEQLYHIIRAFHVSGRCTDCGECSRVCPEHIPLHLFNRKFIKDINELYGDYQAGEESEGKTPLTSYTTADKEPNFLVEKEGK
ncbi:MAG: 4Fe-4S dicluster domain-containing protein [Firmicutes bacterium]|nr:4Fe-4S dicluster domain-containing protein [Candidatus Caballimonas caccae]